MINRSNKTKCKRYLHLFIITLIGIGVQTLRAQSDPITIKQAIDIAFANNYGLQADSLNTVSYTHLTLPTILRV